MHDLGNPGHIQSMIAYTILTEYFLKFQLKLHCGNAGADCKVSNTQMFQGESFEGGTFEDQLVPWSVKIVRELPSFPI